MKQTCLFPSHQQLGAKMAPFGGYMMPIQYEGIIKEHQSCRERSAVFDTCHMGEFSIKGPTAIKDLEKLLSCTVETIAVGQCRYGFICNESGGVIDDQILYRIADNEFFMVVNAATEPNDFQWIKSHLSPTTEIINLSEETAKIDIQGPLAPKIVQSFLERPLDGMKYYHFAHNYYKGTKVLVSRTGYTGEIGFEIYSSIETGKDIWNTCINAGVTPAGLGCRDTLRLEMGFPLYGHELDESTNASESGFSRSIATDKDFTGSSFVNSSTGVKRKLVGITIEGRRAARHGDTVELNGDPIGKVTSGSFCPSVQKAVAMAYVDKQMSSPGTLLQIDTGRQKLDGIVTEFPFYKQATGRRALKDFL